MSWRDPAWKYVPSAAHQTPEYLRAKFRKLQREIDAKKKQPGIVTPITKARKS